MATHRRGSRESGISKLFQSYGALPKTRGLGEASSSPVTIFPIPDPASNAVLPQGDEYLVVAAVEVENRDEHRLWIDDVRLKMPWGEQARLLPDPRERNSVLDYYPGGFARELILNHQITRGKYLVGYGGSLQGLLLGTIDFCPPASTQRALVAEFSIIFTNGSASHAELLLSNATCDSAGRTLAAGEKLSLKDQNRVFAERPMKNDPL